MEQGLGLIRVDDPLSAISFSEVLHVSTALDLLTYCLTDGEYQVLSKAAPLGCSLLILPAP